MTHTYFQNRGFTLLEILVVISIIAIGMGLIVVSISPNDPRRELRKEAYNVKQTVKLLVDEAIFKHKELGIKVHEHHLSFMERDAQTQAWQKLSQAEDTFYEDYQFPGYITVFLEMEDVEVFLNPLQDELEQSIASIQPLENFDQFEEEEEQLKPDIYIFSSGELTAFTLEFRIEGIDDYVYAVSANDIGRVSCRALHNEEEEC